MTLSCIRVLAGTANPRLAVSSHVRRLTLLRRHESPLGYGIGAFLSGMGACFNSRADRNLDLT